MQHVSVQLLRLEDGCLASTAPMLGVFNPGRPYLCDNLHSPRRRLSVACSVSECLIVGFPCFAMGKLMITLRVGTAYQKPPTHPLPVLWGLMGHSIKNRPAPAWWSRQPVRNSHCHHSRRRTPRDPQRKSERIYMYAPISRIVVCDSKPLTPHVCLTRYSACSCL